MRRSRPTRVIACRPSYTACVEIVPSVWRTRLAIVSVSGGPDSSPTARRTATRVVVARRPRSRSCSARSSAAGRITGSYRSSAWLPGARPERRRARRDGAGGPQPAGGAPAHPAGGRRPRRPRPRAQRLRHVRQVAAHRALGRLAVARGDRVDDRGVLAVRALRAARQQDRAVLEAHDLRDQEAGQAAHRVVAGDLDDPPVQPRVRVRDGDEVAALALRAHLAKDRAQLAHVLRRRPPGRLARGQALERGTDLEDLDRLALGHTAHARAAVALALDEAVVLEAHERHAHRAAPHAEPARQVLLDEPLARQQVARDDRVAQSLVSVVVDHVGGDHNCRPDCRQSCRIADDTRRRRERPMSVRTSPPFRADHVGSLLRPPEVLKAREDRSAGRISHDDLRAIEDDAIREVIRRQEQTGLKSVTDGEFRRESWHMDFIYELGGVTQVQDDTIHVHFENAEREYDWAPPSAHVTSTVTLPKTIFAEHFEFLRDNVRSGTPKITIPSPSMVHYRCGRSGIESTRGPATGEFWADLTAADAQQVRALAELGCTYLQLDDTSLAYVNDPKQREHIAEIGGDPEHQHEQYIANINRAIADRPEGLSVTTHMCRGNNQSMWAASGSYDFVADALFNQLEVDGFFMEWDDERSGGFEPLRYVPKGKTVVLGLVTTKRPELEDKDMLKRRIEEASKYVDVDQLCLSPQCGFSSTREGNDLTADEQFAKLELVVETAAEVWGE